MTEFFRFPQTPHLVWLGEGQPRSDKILAPHETETLLSGDVVVEEKVDGANIGFSTSEDGELRVQNRGNYLERSRVHPQFRPLWRWMQVRERALMDALWPDRILFGEWCYAVHSMLYTDLPDWFLGFDVYDLSVARFWDTARRDSLLSALDLHSVPRIAKGHFTIEMVKRMLSNRSGVSNGEVEGLILRRESGGFTTARAKLVRAEFTQAIEEHWSRGPLRRNQLSEGRMPGA